MMVSGTVSGTAAILPCLKDLPPDRVTPRSPICVKSPAGPRRCMSGRRQHASMTFSYRSSLKADPKMILFRSEVLRTKGSCAAYDKVPEIESAVLLEDFGGTSPRRALSNRVFPDPTFPTTATTSDFLIRSDMSRNAKLSGAEGAVSSSSPSSTVPSSRGPISRGPFSRFALELCRESRKSSSSGLIEKHPFLSSSTTFSSFWSSPDSLELL
jgi:hypothetical protein